ncbi:MAG: Rqc2 family fibronectin-binding protein [Thermincolia bacterium]
MSFDGIVLAAIRSQLAKEITGSRIDRVYQPEGEEIILHLRRPGENQRLLISAHAQNARVHLTAIQKPNPMEPPMFCMVLRKHLEGGKITAVRQPGLERVLNIHVEGYDELGALAEKILVCEIMGKHSNIILLDPSTNTILDGVKRYTHALSRHREVLPGRPYLAPPAQDKHDPLTLEEEAFHGIMLGSALNSQVTKVIQKNFEGLSPLLCREIASRPALDQDLTLDHCGEYELTRLWATLTNLFREVREENFQPTLVFDPWGQVTAFSAVDLTQYSCWKKETGSMSQILDKYYTQKEHQAKFGQRQQTILKLVQGELDRLGKKVQIQQENIRDAEAAEELRLWGELITANLYQLQKGQESVELVNYYDPEGSTVKVRLDLQRTPAENAQVYFKRYTKAKYSGNLAVQYLEEYQQEIDYLESVATSIQQATTLSELIEIKEEMAAQGYLKVKETTKGKKNKKPGAAPKQELSQPLAFTSTDGITIMVGKNNKQNDQLTLRTAHPEDIWLHVKNIPGSHVIIRCNGTAQVPETTLHQAATLAAYYSKARGSSNIPVDYTLRKHVHKPRGAKPGMVIYDNQRTLFVTPNEESIIIP